MNFTIDRNALLKPLGHVYSVVERRNTIPILSNVLIETNSSKVSFTATDMDMDIVEETSCIVSSQGKVTLSAHTLYDIVRKLPDGSEVKIEYQSNEKNSKDVILADKTLIAVGRKPYTEGLNLSNVGNIYVTEALWESKISPKRLGKNINQVDCINLIRSIKKVLKKAIRYGGTSLKDFRNVGGEFGYFQNKLNAYGKENKKCSRIKCKGELSKVFISGRSSFFCTVCQKK